MILKYGNAQLALEENNQTFVLTHKVDISARNKSIFKYFDKSEVSGKANHEIFPVLKWGCQSCIGMCFNAL